MELVLIVFTSLKNYLNQGPSQLLLSLNLVSLPKTQDQGVYTHYAPEVVCVFAITLNKTLCLTVLIPVSLTCILKRPEFSSIFQLSLCCKCDVFQKVVNGL